MPGSHLETMLGRPKGKARAELLGSTADRATQSESSADDEDETVTEIV
jgi:hypothetical protein